MTTPHKCPVCDGAGKVERPPWVAGDIGTWVGNGTGPFQCPACSGTGVVWEPVPVWVSEPCPSCGKSPCDRSCTGCASWNVKSSSLEGGKDE